MERLAKYLPGAKTPIRIAKFPKPRPTMKRARAGKFLDGQGPGAEAALAGGWFGRNRRGWGVGEVKAEVAADIGYFPAVRVNQRRRISA
jgi:hypothetical protein